MVERGPVDRRWRANYHVCVNGTTEFMSPSTHGFVRVSVCVPRLKVADPRFNVERTIELARLASSRGSSLVLFPELGITAYSNEDLFHQDTLLDGALDALAELADESHSLASVVIVGAPLRFEQRLFNCAVAIYRGEVIAVTPKTYLPNYREFYEKRQFASGRDAVGNRISLLGCDVPFGSDVVIRAA